ncbi:hypothetical protein [Winogradskyella sp. PC D3.3]
MKLSIIFILIICFQSIYSQEKELFEIEITTNKISDFKNEYDKFKKSNEYFYEDENYIVKDSCRGEFGGIVQFINKKTNKINVAEATCPSSLIKINGNYYLTTSLAHMSGSSAIYEISDPNELTELKDTDSEKDKFFKKKSDTGMKKLYENFSGTISVSFPYENELYFIISDSNGTFLTKRKNSELIKIKKLLDYKVFTYETAITVTADNHYVSNFQLYEGKEVGFFDIKSDLIKINIYK